MIKKGLFIYIAVLWFANSSFSMEEDPCTILPNLATRLSLFNYFFHQAGFVPEPINLAFLARKTDRFSVNDIKSVVAHIVDIYKRNDCSCTVADIYAGLYYDQTINFADLCIRTALFDYYLRDEDIECNYFSLQDICLMLAYFAEDNFTGQEIERAVSNACDIAKLEDSAVTEKHLIIALYEQLLKKAKRFMITTSLALGAPKLIESPFDIRQIIFPMEQRPPMIISSIEMKELPEDQKYLQKISCGSGYYTKTRIDYRTKRNPSAIAKYILFQHLLEDVTHELSANQICYLACQTEKLSWYSLGQLINLAISHQVGTCSSIVKFKHFISAAYEFGITINEMVSQ